MPPKQVQLTVQNISRSFAGRGGDVNVLDDLSFTINERDFVSIIGPSGCGKTTIFNIIAGLLEPDGGTITYRGKEIESLRGCVGHMMQKDLLFPVAHGDGQCVARAGDARRRPKKEAEEKARRYLKQFGLVGLERLSQDSVRRNAIACGADPYADHGSLISCCSTSHSRRWIA